MGATLLTRWLDYGTFGWVDQAGALVALMGVVLVVQPDDVFSHPEPLMPRSFHEAQKFTKGVVCSIVGVLGGIVSLWFPFHEFAICKCPMVCNNFAVLADRKTDLYAYR